MQQDRKRHANTYIVGAPKSGTSAMAAWLNEHPNAFLCDPKEPFFWSDDYPGLQKRYGMSSLEAYGGLFADAPAQANVLVDGSTNYLASENAIGRIVEQDPDARFIAMIRNPVDVVHAFHSEILVGGIESEKDFEAAWRLQDRRKTGKVLPFDCEAPQFLQYAEVANYARQFERFFSLVPETQRHVILFDDFAADPESCFHDVLQFLDLSDFQKEDFQKVNASHGHRFELISNLILRPPRILKPLMDAGRSFARQHKGGVLDSVKNWLQVPHKRESLSQGFKQELKDFFRPGIQATATILQKDLSMWLQEPFKHTKGTH